MKRILFLLLLTVSVYGQNPSRFLKIQITGNTNSATATKVNVQEANGEVNTQTINTGFNKNIGLGGSDVVGANTLLNQYATTPIDWTATAFNSGQIVFYGAKQWIAKMATVAGDVPAVSSKWEEITFEALSNKTVIVDATPTDGSNNAVSSNGVFDALSTKAPISSVHNPVTIGTANGLSLSTQVLSLGLASSGVTGALSGTDWNTFNGKFPTPTGLTTNYIPKWNGSGFGNSLIYDSGTNVGIGTTTPVEKLDVVGAGRFVTADLGFADGTTNYYVAKPLGSIGDFATSVILLHPVYIGTLITHYECNGTITARRGNSYAGLNTGSISINSTTAYNNNIYNISYVNTNSNIYKLVTCDFGGVKYLALRADLSDEAQAKSFFFDGYSQGDSNALQIKAIGAVTNVVVVSSNGEREIEGLTVSGNITASPAILSNHVVVKSQLDALASSGTYTPSNQTNAAQTVNFIRSYWERKGNVLTVTTSLTYTVTQIQSTASFLITLPNGFLVSGANGRIIGSSLLHTTQGIFNNNANMKAFEAFDSSQINLQANFQASVSSGTYETTIIYTVLIQ